LQQAVIRLVVMKIGRIRVLVVLDVINNYEENIGFQYVVPLKNYFGLHYRTSRIDFS
jgi:hypothetical protein